MDGIIENKLKAFIERADAAGNISIGECEAFLNEVPSFTNKHSVGDTKEFLDFLGNPDENMKIIHVAGTNGKGSVCSYLSSILMKAGYTVGMFTSPHLVSIAERFCIDGRCISDRMFAEIFIELLRRIAEYDREDYFPTYFEFLFFMAMLLYDVYPVDYLVLETGLGGRLDATNTVHEPQISIITEIGLDHTQYLGNTIEEIAYEKAGIIKSNVPVIFFDKREKSTGVIQKRAEELDVRAIGISPQSIENVRRIKDDTGNKYIAFSYNSIYDRYVDLKLTTEGAYQAENAAIAVTACEILRDSGAAIAEPDIREGLLSAKWSGRMEEIRPGIYVDGAHNLDGIDAFLDSVRDIPSEGRKLLMFGIVSDKSYRAVIDRLMLSGEFDAVYAAVLDTPRSVPLSELKAAFENSKEEHGIFGVPVRFYTNVRDAVTDVITIRKSGDTVFAAGSLYLVGEIKAMM